VAAVAATVDDPGPRRVAARARGAHHVHAQRCSLRRCGPHPVRQAVRGGGCRRSCPPT
jgi:hypothetical protein